MTHLCVKLKVGWFIILQRERGAISNGALHLGVALYGVPAGSTVAAMVYGSD